MISELIRSNKIANPITLKTFLPATLDIAGLSVAQYLARLAAEATTVINAADYGRTVYDLAVRRELIKIAEDMLNDAFDAAVALRKIRSSMPSSFYTKSPKRDAMAAASRRLRPRWTTPLTGPRKLTSPTAGSRGLLLASGILMPKWAVFNQRTS